MSRNPFVSNLLGRASRTEPALRDTVVHLHDPEDPPPAFPRAWIDIITLQRQIADLLALRADEVERHRQATAIHQQTLARADTEITRIQAALAEERERMAMMLKPLNM